MKAELIPSDLVRALTRQFETWEVFAQTAAGESRRYRNNQPSRVSSHRWQGWSVRAVHQDRALLVSRTGKLPDPAVIVRALRDQFEVLPPSRNHFIARTIGSHRGYISPARCVRRSDYRRLRAWADGLAFERRDVISFEKSVSFSESHSVLQNDLGLRVEWADAAVGMSASFVVKDGPGMRSGGWSETRLTPKKINPGRVVARGYREARELRGARPLESGAYDVLFDEETAGMLLGGLLDSLNGAAVVDGTSHFRDAVGRQIVSSAVTVIDDPMMPGGLASAWVDDEGTPAQRTVLIENGVLKSFLLDYRTSMILGLPNNAKASRGLTAPPSPEPTNLTLKPGLRGERKLAEKMRRGVWIKDLRFGGGMDTLTGEFSAAVEGIYVQDGEPQYPVRGAALSGNLFNLFREIEEVGRCHERVGDVECPPLLVRKQKLASAR